MLARFKINGTFTWRAAGGASVPKDLLPKSLVLWVCPHTFIMSL